jgi:hypothetical protein
VLGVFGFVVSQIYIYICETTNAVYLFRFTVYPLNI